MTDTTKLDRRTFLKSSPITTPSLSLLPAFAADKAPKLWAKPIAASRPAHTARSASASGLGADMSPGSPPTP